MPLCISQLRFSFYSNQPIRADFSGGQITSEAGLMLLRAFDERYHLSRDWAACLGGRVGSTGWNTKGWQPINQIVAGYEDGNDATQPRHYPMLRWRSSPTIS